MDYMSSSLENVLGEATCPQCLERVEVGIWIEQDTEGDRSISVMDKQCPNCTERVDCWEDIEIF